jgi:hypothetical protein
MLYKFLYNKQPHIHPTLLAHLHFSNVKADVKNANEPAIFLHNQHDMTVQNTRGEDLPAPNSTYKKLAVQWLNEVLCFVSSSVVADSFVLRNRQLLVAANRYSQFYYDH